MFFPLSADEYARKRFFLTRTIVIVVVMLTAIAVLVFNLFNLQILDQKHYRTLSEENRLNLVPFPPPRGLIHDRNQRLVAGNRTVYGLEIMPSQVEDLEATIAMLEGIVSISEDDKKRFRRALATQPSFHSIMLRPYLNEYEVARLAVERHRLHGVEVAGRLVRHYPYRELFAHVVGYVGGIDEADLKNVDRRNYRGSRYIGKVGIEKHYERAFHGAVGFRRIEVNARGRMIRVVENHNPRPGDDVMLTIDADMQREAHDALGDVEGALVALDTVNGDVLALVSKPSFDPNLFSMPFSSKAYRQLQNHPLKPFFNRAVSGQYPPGSTIKPLVALATLQNRTIGMHQSMYAGPYYQLSGHERRYRDWRKQGHGWVNLSRAITQSCDVFFYDVAHRMGIDRLSDFLAGFGLGEITGIDTTSEMPGLVPSRQWKRNALAESWFPAETIMTGIGQSYMLATPLQLAVMTATIADRGRRLQPRLVRAFRRAGSDTWQYRPPVELPLVADLRPEYWDYVVNAMANVVHKPNGTAYRIGRDLEEYSIAGKTGTAQVSRLADEDEEQPEQVQRELMDHAMFIAFAPVEQPEIAVAVIAEHAGSGARRAAPVARRFLDAWFAGRQAQVSALQANTP